MTTNVIDIASRRRPADICCARHELDALAHRIGRRLDESVEVLLIPREHLEQALADLLATVDRLLPTPGRREEPHV